VIDVENLTKRYGARDAVLNVSFSVQKGEIVGFLGPNGAGKTTTLRMITGFLLPTAGRVRVDGLDAVAQSIRARERIGYMPEGVPLHPEMRVSEYLRFRAELKGVSRRDVGKSVERSLELANIKDVSERIVGQLSKGYRQRVGLADALVADPPILILDEPTSGLDPNQIRQVRDLIRSLAGKKTVLLSTHILPEVEASCGRVLIIDKGKLVGEGAPQTLREKSKSSQTVSVVARVSGDKDHPYRSGAGGFEALVRSIAGVRTVRVTQMTQDVVEASIATDAGHETVERLFEAFVQAGWILRELHVAAASLEDVFTSLTVSEARPEPEPEAESEPKSEPAAPDKQDPPPTEEKP